MGYSLQVQGLSYTYPGGTRALQGVNLMVQPGERVALVGANGSGKSTLLRHLNGLLLAEPGRSPGEFSQDKRPRQHLFQDQLSQNQLSQGQLSQGQLWVEDLAIAPANLVEIRNRVGLVFQNPDDQLFMPTVAEDLAFGPTNQGLSAAEIGDRITAAMQAVGLTLSDYAARSPHQLSGGEKKRIAIAGVLAMQPQTLLLDEPSAQLDPRSRRGLIELLRGLALTQIIATHDLDLALDLCDRTVVLSQGQVVYDGGTAEIMAQPQVLAQYALEAPLSFQRPYCRITDGV